MHQNLHLPAVWDGNLWSCGHLGRARSRHRHIELEFNLVTRGTGTYLLSNRKYRIQRGDLLWLFPAQKHVLVRETRDFRMWIGVLKPGVVRRVATDPHTRILCRTNPPGDYCRRLDYLSMARLEELFNEISAARDCPALFNASLAYAILTAWRYFEQAKDRPPSDVHPAVERVAQLIRGDVATHRLREIAQQSGLGAPRLSRLFKQQTGSSWVEYRNRERLRRYLQLYGTGQRRTMLEAALQAGFGSYPQFHRVFRQAMGCSPADYRRQGVGAHLRPKNQEREA